MILSSLPGKFKCSVFEWFSCPEGITPNSGLTGPNNTYIYIYIYKRQRQFSIYEIEEMAFCKEVGVSLSLSLSIYIYIYRLLFAFTRQEGDDTLHKSWLCWWHSASSKYTRQVESRAAGGIGLHVNVDKKEFLYINKIGEISTLNGGSLRRVDKFAYLGSSVSSTENINTLQAKARTAIDGYRSYGSQKYLIK